ncbi:MAG: hypothetical protein ACI8PZ_007551 [Myxococcota bacterium]
MANPLSVARTYADEGAAQVGGTPDAASRGLRGQETKSLATESAMPRMGRTHASRHRLSLLPPAAPIDHPVDQSNAHRVTQNARTPEPPTVPQHDRHKV